MRLQGVRVLLVEDHQDSLEMFRTVLGHHGAAADCVRTVADALEAAQTAQPDVLVAELSLADNGVPLVPELRRILGRPVPAICVSGHARPKDHDRAVAAGFQLFLPKPVDPEVLVTVIGRVSQRRLG